MRSLVSRSLLMRLVAVKEGEAPVTIKKEV